MSSTRTERRRLVLPEGRLYGRRTELARIDACLERVVAGEGSALVLVAGPAGIGKSALVAHAKRHSRARVVLHAKAEAERQDTPFGALDGAEASLRARLHEPEAQAKLLVLDDLQWFDGATLDLVRELLVEVPDLVVIGTYRDADLAQPFPGIDGVRRELVALPPLELEDATQLVADALERDPVAIGALVRFVHHRTGGNPLFMAQFLATLAEDGVLAWDEGTRDWQWDEARLGIRDYTENVLELVGNRLARLPAEVTRALELLACLGFAVEERILLAAYDGNPEELHAALWQATALANVVYRSSTGYRFLHDRLREAAYARLPEADRATMHVRIGRRLRARLDVAVPAELHAILEQLNRVPASIEDAAERRDLGELNRRAAAHARAAGAWTGARAYLRNALALAPEDPFELALGLAECELRLGPEPAGRYEELLALAGPARAAGVHALFVRLGPLHGSFAVAATRALAALDGIADPAAKLDLVASALPALRGARPDEHVRAVALGLALAAHVDAPAAAYVRGHQALLLARDPATAAEASAVIDDALRANPGAHRGALLVIRACAVRPGPASAATLDEAAAACAEAGDALHLGWLAIDAIWHALHREASLATVAQLAARTHAHGAQLATVRVLQAAIGRLRGTPEKEPADARIAEAGFALGLAIADVASGAGTSAVLRGTIFDEPAPAETADLATLRAHEEAYRVAREQGSPRREALACERAARFCREQGLPRMALGYLRTARDACRRWGADGKARELRGDEVDEVGALGAIARLAVEERDVHAIARRTAEHAVTHGRATAARVVLPEEAGFSAHAGIPLAHDGAVLGVLVLEGTPDAALVALLAGQASVALAAAHDRERLRVAQAAQQRAEAALRRTEALLEVAEKLSRTGTFGWNPSSDQYLHWSEEMRRIGGFDATPGLAEVFERTHPDDRAHVSRAVELASRDGSDLDVKHRFLLPGGVVHHVHMRARNIAAAPALEYVGVVSDITHHHDLQQTRAELSHVNRVTTVGELAASIAHEINQPLAAIVADANAAMNWLARPSPGLTEARESLEAIARDGVRVSEILDRIRALLSRRAIAASRCDPCMLIHGVLPLVHPELARVGIQVETLLDAAPPVEGDVVQLQQVLINLLMNARDASRDVSVDRRLLRVRLGTAERDARRFARISVEDAGIGLGEDPARVFEPFFTTKSDGLGMGLAISRSIVERHGGKLWGETNERAGATFHIALPEAP